MCTSVSFKKNGKFLFGRNLDLEYEFGDGVLFMPRNYPLRLRSGEIALRHYALMGVGIVKGDYPLYADGMNEHGLCIAGLRFPDSSGYSMTAKDGYTNLAPFEIIPYLLAKCKNTEEARAVLDRCNVVDIPFDDDTPNAPMHFHISDGADDLTLEFYGGKMNVYENTPGVLTNSPPFPFHLYNLSHYLRIGRDTPKSQMGAVIFGAGLSSCGLPGDFSSTSRFVRAAWLRENFECDAASEARALLSLLQLVAVPEGCVMTESGKRHFTRYSAVMDTENKHFIILRSSPLQPTTASMKKESLDEDSLEIVSF